MAVGAAFQVLDVGCSMFARADFRAALNGGSGLGLILALSGFSISL